MDKDLLDLGESINLIHLTMLKKIKDLEIKPTKMTLQLADRVTKYPYGVVEDVFVKVDKLIVTRIKIDIDSGKLKVRTQSDETTFNLFL